MMLHYYYCYWFCIKAATLIVADKAGRGLAYVLHHVLTVASQAQRTHVCVRCWFLQSEGMEVRKMDGDTMMQQSPALLCDVRTKVHGCVAS